MVKSLSYYSNNIAAGLVFVLLATALCVSGCAAPARNALPDNLAHTAQIPGISRAYVWGDENPSVDEVEVAQYRARLKRLAAERGPEILTRPINYLALSGGGANGAFGAGLLTGWSAVGTRPVFDVVTGISTGAIIAPFAFLGTDYDKTLQHIYTQYRTEDALQFRSAVSTLLGESAADVSGMKHLIEHHVDEKVMKALATEYDKGRGLFVGTTNLDAGRPVIWNIGRISRSGSPQALALIRDIVLASASIPGVFPPVMIEYEGDGQRYEEMHVDGGVTRQVFLFPAAMDWQKQIRKMGYTGRQRLYVIFNSTLEHRREVVDYNIFNISARSIGTLIKTQGIGDLYKLYLISQRNNIDYNLAFIPFDFKEESQEFFDSEYMKKLFQLGLQIGRKSDPWHHLPPEFLESPISD